jgi:hypothetical protein
LTAHGVEFVNVGARWHDVHPFDGLPSAVRRWRLGADED